MSDISLTTINYLNSLYSQTQNGVKEIIGVQAFLSGPFKLIISNRTLDDFVRFLNNGQFSTRLGTKGEERNLLEFDLSESPKKIFTYDPNDDFLTGTLNACVNEFILADGKHNFDIDISESVQRYYKNLHKEAALNTPSQIRKHFYDTYFFEYDAFYETNASGRTYKKFPSAGEAASIALIVKYAMATRVNNWIKAKEGRANRTDEQFLIELEQAFLTEEYNWESTSYVIEESTGLKDFLNAAINRDKDNFTGVDAAYSSLFQKAFLEGNINKISDKDKRFFLSTFRGSDLERAATINSSTVNSLISKIEQSGLLRLASYAGSVSEFARQRLSSVEQLKRSPLDSQDPVRDIAWLSQLNETVQYLSRDPITLGIINVYFPSLVSFFFESIAVTVDYSNSGRGGGEEDTVNSLQDFIKSLEKAFGRTVDFNGKDITGSIFQLAANYENTAKKMKAALDASPYRDNIQPISPDIFHLRLGASNFYVPPLTIDVNTFFKAGSLTGGALRQKSSPKFNSGYKETSIRIKLFFPNYEEIWGISIDDASKITLNDNFQIDFGVDGSGNEKIDKFLSSLRGLIAAFKYSPFLPVRNQYLNSVHQVTAVALSSMSISTVPNFPFALAVDIELLNFNHKPFLPMINDFNQAIHWGKYRQYMGKAAGALHNYVNGSFLMKTSNDKEAPGTKEVEYKVTPYGASIVTDSVYRDEKFITNIISEWTDGKNISFYIPAETQTKIFLPDSTSFRTDEEKLLKDSGQDFWGKILNSFGVDLNESAGYGIQLSGVYQLSRNSTVSPSIQYHLKNAIDLLTAGLSDKTSQRSIYSYVATIFIQQNNLGGSEAQYIRDFDATNAPASTPKNYKFQSSDLGGKNGITLFQAKQFLKKISTSTNAMLDNQVENLTKEKARKAKIKPNTKQYESLKAEIREQVKEGFNILVYERFFKSAPIEALMEAARQKSGSFSFREWEVPMIKVDLDPASVIVTGVSLTLGNNLAKLQLQMQDEPTYQHIGGRDTYINISMRITGESELNKIKRIFDHVNALARLEHSTGVLGFIGIKNVITALSGVKYVLPSNYSVNTVPNYPHVYDVNIALLDFDIFQQAREKLSSKQQRQLIEEFGSKRNPFFRIKQMWGIFNAYPDFPLEVKDKNNEVVGHLDPDFYFRSFEMFDKDVINNIQYRPKQLALPGNNQGIGKQTIDLVSHPVGQKIVDLIRTYSNNYNFADYAGDKVQIEKDLVNEVITYLQINEISYESFLAFFNAYISNPNLVERSSSNDLAIFKLVKKNKKLITDAIEYDETDKVQDTEASFSNAVSAAPYEVGDLSAANQKLLAQIQSALDGKYSLKEEEEVSFSLDDLDFVANMYTFPIIDQNEPTKIPSMLSIGSQVHLGYIDTEKDGRFYLTIDGVNVKKSDRGNILTGRNITDDHSDPSKVNTNSSIYSLTPMSEYGKPYSGSLESHWERTLVDTQYRDISGRMLRAFPTYMLWLIDEGGMTAGVKLFDNFYGLQSIIDFSIVSSEDLVGDTLVFRVSNLYSKLSKKESSAIFNPNLDKYGDEITQDNPGITEGLSSVIDVTLNKARNILAHMQNEYVVDIENIRLKPGVRVHLRGGYGANPNSLQTLFNGTITEVEQGEIVTVIAQSDAIELGAVVNSTNKKGDSGKIDGGINTGLWLSEPRDLMVRLLSMGTSRFREAVAYANRGIVFSENKFGIRHFGSMIYEPLSTEEEIKHFSRIDAIAESYNLVGSGNVGSAAGQLSDALITGTPEYRVGVFGLMNQLWSNFSSQRDFEVFKRNIYPGNGTGIAQFLGGDLGDGWTSVASITPESQPNDRIDYLSRLTDRTWNSLVSKAGQETGADAKIAIENMTSGGATIASGSGGVAKAALISGLGIGIGVAGAPIAGAVTAGALLGVLKGRGGNNIFRMLGLVSANDDDDMPGFDEVSFRAQTYMRTVWDLFKTCARLLPNYIVAVRPFEDRSTVFYGKPHWLYTSGLVPITTGHPNESKMAELGLSGGPKIIDPDYGLAEIMSHINQQSSPYADASAFVKSKEPIEALQEIAVLQQKSQSYFQASGVLKGKVINFDSIKSQTVIGIDPDTKRPGKILAKLPQNKGMVTIGFHLPVRSKNQTYNRTPSSISDVNPIAITGTHQQVSQLPPRFRFPFFTYKGIASGKVLENYSFQYNSPVNVGSVYGAVDVKTSVTNVSNYRESIEKMYGQEFVIQLNEDSEKFDLANRSRLVASNPLENSYSFSNSNLEYEQAQAAMPLPNNDVITFSEWTAPENEIDEQFYIAMRWPYIPPQDVDKFFSKYFTNKMTKNELVGEAKDYKNAHVLVYNPTNNVAVVCKPAYFLWGNETTSTTQTDQAVTPEGGTSLQENIGKWNIENDVQIDAVVSPDAGYFLSVLSGERVIYTDSKKGSFGGFAVNVGPGYRDTPMPQECYFAFVPNTVPLGVATSMFVPIKKFKAKDISGKEIDDFVIGFGNFDSQENLQAELTDFNDSFYRTNPQLQLEKTSINEYTPINDLVEIDYKHGGNYRTYFQKYLSAAPASSNNSVFEDPVSREIGLDLLDASGAQTGDNVAGTGNTYFAPVFSIADSTSIEARKYYDEEYDLNTSVIAGNGRTLDEAEQIWNQFRIGYHTYDSVQAIFSETFGLDPNNDNEFPDFIKNLFINDSSTNNVFKKFFESSGSARDEFSILFGNEITGQESLAIEFARKNFIDASAENNGLVEYFNSLLGNKIKAFKDNFLVYNDAFLRGQLGEEVDSPSSAVRGELIKTPRQLFLTLVGIFRQTMWQDPYARAWLVLKPSRKVGLFRSENEQWDFKAVDKIFAAFINPNNTYAKDKRKLMQLLYNNRGEGSSATNIVSKTTSSIDNFWDRNVGVIFSAMGTALQGLLQMFKLNMMQTGYGISQAGQLGRQANILNRALNDSIYYQLGRPGSLLRAVDNPFTREYGEPVLEVREPFQRIHYLSSFSHILSNQIKETNSNVSTVITAVSDGKYPVTVALDKGASPERMNETTVETGIYFDNPVGEGFFGFLHPLLHPFETTRGVIKNVTGSPDELAAKRIALSHLKENIKDIYGGELIVVGNADIRPHDLVYIADVYERMYGIVEVEQVIHHFTSELGFITSITPNALVTVNDPARWFMTSWIDSWMNTQAIRNDTRLFIDAVRANNSGISSGGNISIDRLSENLNAQMLGGIKYTHGASAVIKDVVASMTYDSFSSNTSFTEEIRKQAQVNGNNGAVGISSFIGGIAGSATVGAGTAAVVGASGVAAAAVALPGAALFGQLLWKGWRWVRDNLLDQHGAYVQYLNKNGQPMDGGLSYNQGMVVGRYHSKALLPGILGIRRRTRTADGHAYVRSDDLFKSLGWNEVEINELVRYISYENALVHSQVLGMANLGPEKTTFEPFFKALCKLDTTEGLPVGTSTTSAGARRSGIIDADTIAVVDVISGSKFRVRFDGINAPEQAVVTSQYGEIQTVANIIDKQSPGYKATSFTANALTDKVFLLRIRQDANGNLAADSSEETFAPGSSTNTEKNYTKELYGRTLATIFYKTSSTNLSNIKNFVLNIFIKNNLDYDKIKKEFKNSFYGSIFAVDKVYEKVYGQIDSLTNVDHSIGVVDGGFLNTITAKNIYSNMVEMKILEELYSSASKWPLVLWDEYYDDGTPYTLNWELVVNNLASVFTRDLLKESNSVNKAVDSLGIPTKVQVK